MAERRTGRRSRVGTVIEALQRAAVEARADSNVQRNRIRQARVKGTYREAMTLELARCIAFEEGVRYALMLAQVAEAASQPIEGVG